MSGVGLDVSTPAKVRKFLARALVAVVVGYAVTPRRRLATGGCPVLPAPLLPVVRLIRTDRPILARQIMHAQERWTPPPRLLVPESGATNGRRSSRGLRCDASCHHTHIRIYTAKLFNLIDIHQSNVDPNQPFVITQSAAPERASGPPGLPARRLPGPAPDGACKQTSADRSNQVVDRSITCVCVQTVDVPTTDLNAPNRRPGSASKPSTQPRVRLKSGSRPEPTSD